MHHHQLISRLPPLCGLLKKTTITGALTQQAGTISEAQQDRQPNTGACKVQAVVTPSGNSKRWAHHALLALHVAVAAAAVRLRGGGVVRILAVELGDGLHLPAPGARLAGIPRRLLIPLPAARKRNVKRATHKSYM
jgi:hypothetical protein